MNFKNKSKVYTLQAEAGKEYRIKIDFAFRNRDAALDFDMGREVPVDLKQTVDKVKEADVIIFAGGISPAVEGDWRMRLRPEKSRAGLDVLSAEPMRKDKTASQKFQARSL